MPFQKIRNHRLIMRLIAILFAALILAACSNAATEPTQPQAAATEPASPAVETVAPPAQATATPTVEPTVPGVSFRNPVLRQDFPDPHIIFVDGVYYAYATNSSGRNIQLAVSEDLINWQVRTDAMPSLPRWAMLGGSFVWAPEVIQIGDTFHLYYTARDKAADKQCVGHAVADSPEGKFRDENDAAFVCQIDEGGTIDASPFRDGDKLYLYFKNDGNCCGRTTYIYAQEMSPDGNSLLGEPVRLVQNNNAWEGAVVEAPTMWKHDDRYYLFFSANNYGGIEYAVGYATCEGPLGPCEDAPENPILKSYLQKPPVIGPGHQTLLQIGEETWIVYHAWEVTRSGIKTSRRFVWMDRIDWEDGKPVIRGPTVDVQPVPQIQP